MLNLEKFIAELAQAETELAGKERELSVQLDAVKADLRKVRDARTCITGKKTARSNRKPAATQSDVQQCVRELLGNQSPLEEAALREQVERRIAEQGKSKQGLALRINEVLKSGEFVETAGGWQPTSMGGWTEQAHG